MDLRQYLKAVRKFWWVIALTTVLGLLLGVFSVARAETSYQAEITFFVKTTGQGTASAAALADQFAQRRVNSYVGLLSSDRLIDLVRDSSTVDVSPNKLRKMLGASGDVDTVLLTATVTSTDRAEVEAVADAVALKFPELVNSVENQGQVPGTTSVTLEVVSGPTVSEVPSRTTTKVGLRVALGLLLGLGIALILEWRDNGVRSAEELVSIGAGPLVGSIPFDRKVRAAPLILEDDPQSLRAEAFRQIRTNLQFMDVDNPLRTLVVTSPVAGEGKSSTSANLALTMAAAGSKVLVIEADLRKPALSDLFGLERALGLTDVLVGQVEIDDVIQPWGTSGVWVLPSGHLPPNPSELLATAAMTTLIDKLQAEFDLVIFDSPPVLPVTDAVVLAAHAEATVLIVRQGKTTRSQVARAVYQLETVGARLLGSILTMTPTGRGHAYGAYRYETSAILPPPSRTDGPPSAKPPTPIHRVRRAPAPDQGAREPRGDARLESGAEPRTPPVSDRT